MCDGGEEDERREDVRVGRQGGPRNTNRGSGGQSLDTRASPSTSGEGTAVDGGAGCRGSAGTVAGAVVWVRPKAEGALTLGRICGSASHGIPQAPRTPRDEGYHWGRMLP